MKKNFLFMVIASVSTLGFCANGCEFLNISVQNYTGQECVLSRLTLQGGSVSGGYFPHQLQNGEMSQTLQIQQSYVTGPNIVLELSCEGKAITLNSQQNYCLFSAGNISTEVWTESNIHARNLYTVGSYWDSLPGHIVWTLF